MSFTPKCPQCGLVGGCTCIPTYPAPLEGPSPSPMGCICPPEANLTCANPLCPRKSPAGFSVANNTKEEG